MTSSARLVLEDAKEALVELLEGTPSGSLWRRRYLTCLTLLRAVGHVLHKVDREAGIGQRKAVDRWWVALKQTRPTPAIFWSFIEDERNLQLKEYRSVAGQNMTVFPGANRPSETTYTMKDGSLAGRDPRELVREAIVWWERELEAIDIDSD